MKRGLGDGGGNGGPMLGGRPRRLEGRLGLLGCCWPWCGSLLL